MKLMLISLILITAGCSSVRSNGAELPVPSQWKLESMGVAGAETSLVEGSAITLQFQEGGQAGGSGGCNSYGAMYETQGKSIAFKDIISTLMACADDQVTQQEAQYFQALQSASEYKFSGDHLAILYDDGHSALNFVKQ